MHKRTAWPAAVITVAAAALIMVVLIDPLWSRLGLHVPGESTRVNFTQPVDGVFYARNAELGYRWGIQNRTSIWFHPLLVWGIDLLPAGVPASLRLWLISLLAGAAALILVPRLHDQLAKDELDPRMISLAVLLPGGLAIATGNAEFVCLVFVSGLLLSLLKNGHPLLLALWGGLAVLAKPNALYMVPVLAVYLVHAMRTGDRRLAGRGLAGIGAILFGLLAWAWFVDLQSHAPGTYWAARRIAIVPQSFSFFERTFRFLLLSQSAAQRLKFSSAIFIPLVETALALVVPLRRELDRAAILAGIAAVMASTLLLNNPNKVMSYMTTLPAHAVVGMIFIREAFKPMEAEGKLEGIVRRSAGTAYLCYCAVMLVYFILGTPLRWYY